MQHTPDGVAFFFNVNTGESTWDVPLVDDDDDVESILPSNIKRSSTRRRNTFSTASTNSSYRRRSRSVDSLSSSFNNILIRSNRPLPENWIQQPTEDGSTYYYYNVQTKDVRWTHPSDSIINTATTVVNE